MKNVILKNVLLCLLLWFVLCIVIFCYFGSVYPEGVYFNKNGLDRAIIAKIFLGINSFVFSCGVFLIKTFCYFKEKRGGYYLMPVVGVGAIYIALFMTVQFLNVLFTTVQ